MPNTTTTVELGGGESLVITCSDERLVIDLYDIASHTDGPSHTRMIPWAKVRDSILGSFAPTPTGEPLPIIPPASERPVCVTVGWLAEHPSFAAKLEYLSHDREPMWLPATRAVVLIDSGWPVEVREVQS